MHAGTLARRLPPPQGYKFMAQVDGSYSFCFDNKMSRWTAKVVDFDLAVKGACGRGAGGRRGR